MDGLPVSPAASSEGGERKALASESDYLRSVCSESSSFIMAQPKISVDAPSKLWITTVFVVMVVLQVASTTGLFVYLNMSMAQVNLIPLILTVALRTLLHDNNISSFCIANVLFLNFFPCMHSHH